MAAREWERRMMRQQLRCSRARVEDAEDEEAATRVLDGARAGEEEDE